MTPVVADGGDLLSEVRSLLEGGGAVMRSRDVLFVHGPDAQSYLQGQCSQDVDALAVGSAADALLLSPEGKVDALVRVVRVAGDGFVVDTDAGFGATVLARLGRFKLRSKLTIEELDWECIALRGGPVPDDLAPAEGGEGEPVGQSVATAWGGWTGRDVLGPRRATRATLPEGFGWCHDAAWEVARLRMGLPDMGHDLDGRTIPAEVDGLVEATVSFTKGCYTGQELVARIDARGNKVARHLRGLEMLGGDVTDMASLLGARVLVAPSGTTTTLGSKAHEPEIPGTGEGGPQHGDLKEVGTVTSAAVDPERGTAIALGFLHRSVDPGTRVILRGESEGGDDPGWTALVHQLPFPTVG